MRSAASLDAGRLLALALAPALALAMLPAMSASTWITLTVAGAAMGMLLFMMAAGLTLIFGLMDVLNFAHGAFITLGAFVAASVLARSGWTAAPGLVPELGVLALAAAAAGLAAAGAGYVFERVLVRRVYGAHLQQILITVGGLIVAEQLLVAVWGAEPLPAPKPALLRGSLFLAGASIEVYRLVAVAAGLAALAALQLVLGRTRLGLLVRAAVENREMVEALGWRVRPLFALVFVAGCALAGVGGALWAAYQEVVTIAVGADMTVLVFVVVIIGGLGSVPGSFVGAVLVGLVTNYVGFLAPRLALGSTLALLVLVLLWRPRGLLPLARG